MGYFAFEGVQYGGSSSQSGRTNEPQVLAVPPEEYEAVATALVVIGHALAAPLQ